MNAWFSYHFDLQWVGATILGVTAVSATFAGLAAKINEDLKENYSGAVITTTHPSWRAKYTWVYFVALKAIVSLMICVFHVVFTARIRISLNKSIAFLKQVNATSNGARAYERIIRFSLAICSVVVVYNLFVLCGEIGVEIRHHLLANDLFNLRFSSQEYSIPYVTLVRYSVNILHCFKPACYGVPYIWVRYH